MGMMISSDFVSGIGVGLQGGAELVDRGHPAEEVLDVEQRRLLHEVGPRLVRGVVQHHAEIFEEEAVAQGRLDADVGGDAGEHQRAYAARAQGAVEVGIVEGAVARLGDDDVSLLRRQLVHDGVVPAALGQQLALQFGLLAHGLHGIGLVIVGRARPAALDIFGIPAVLEIDHLDPGGARCVGRLLDPGDRGRRTRNVEARVIEITAGRGVGVLHVDDDQRRLRGLDQYRLGPRLEMTAGRIVRGEVADGLGHSAASATRDGAADWMCLRHFISGWMRSPNSFVPLTNSSKVSSTPAMPGMVATSSIMRATEAWEPHSRPMLRLTLLTSDDMWRTLVSAPDLVSAELWAESHFSASWSAPDL